MFKWKRQSLTYLLHFFSTFGGMNAYLDPMMTVPVRRNYASKLSFFRGNMGFIIQNINDSIMFNVFK